MRLSLIALLLCACSLSPPDAAVEIACADSSDCPADRACAPSGRCVDPEALTSTTLSFTRELELGREVLGLGDASVNGSASFSAAPARVDVLIGNRVVDVECPAQGVDWNCSIPINDAQIRLTITVVGVDALGREVTSSAEVEIDREEPTIVSTPSIRVRTLPGSVINAPTAAAPGAAIEAVFIASEPLRLSTRVFIAALDMVLIDGSGDPLEVVAAGNIPLDAADGIYEIEAELVDLAGNISQVTVGSVVVDGTSPLAVDESRIVYARAPWGGGESQFPSFSVRGDDGSAEPGVLILAHIDAPDGLVVGTGSASPTGAFAIELAPVDRPRLFLEPVDRAGNRGEVRATTRSTWRVSLGGKRFGDTLLNPHELLEVRAHHPALIGREREHADVEGFGALDDKRVTTTSEVRFDDLVARANDTNDHLGTSFAFDARRGQLLRSGGSNILIGSRGQLQELRGDSWFDTPVLPDSPRFSHIAYDDTRESIVAFDDGIMVLEAGAWRRDQSFIAPGTVLGLRYDYAAGALVLLGDNTVRVDGPLLRSIGGVPPSSFANHANDPVSGEVIVYSQGLFRVAGDAWEEVAFPFSGPGMIFTDRRRGRLLFLETGNSDGTLRLFAVDLSTQTPTELTAFPASSSSFFDAALDPRRDRLIVVGTLGLGARLNITVDLETLEVGSLSVPFGNSNARLRKRVFDKAHGVVLAHGFRFAADSADFELGAERFASPIVPLDDPPANTAFAPLFVRDGRATFFAQDEFVVLDNGGWQSTPHAHAGAGANASVATLDERRALVVRTDETLLLEGDTLTVLPQATQPEGCDGHAVDTQRDEVLCLSAAQIWRFRDDVWSSVATIPGGDAEIVYDDARDMVRVFLSNPARSLESDGGTFVDRPIDPEFSALDLLYAPDTARIFNIGGDDDIQGVLASPSDARAAHVLHFDPALAGLASAEITLVDVEAVTGARGHTDEGERVSEVELQVWLGHWRTLMTQPADIDQLAELSHALMSRPMIQQLRGGARFALVSPPEGKAPAGEGAQIETARFEVVFHFEESP